ncbi:MAG: hypothetical protein WAN50_02890 [Minisyncoccia bacterium]
MPIRPDQIVAAKQATFPDAVIKAFNELITRDYNGRSAIVYQSEVVALMVEKGLSQVEITANDYLDVEDVYRASGWKVEYDAPAYGENSYPPYFKFTKK